MAIWRCWRKIDKVFPDDEGTTFYLPRQNQGQIVDVSYAAGGGVIYCHIYDRSDNSHELFCRDRKVSDGDCDFWDWPPEPTRVCGSQRYL